MSTRSIIAVIAADGGFWSIYSHFDGYPDGVGAELVADFNSRGDAVKLMAKGDGSSLTESYKDRGETDVDARFSSDFDSLHELAGRIGGEYVYIWDNGWRCWECGGAELIIPGNTNRTALRQTQKDMVLEYLTEEGCITPCEAEEMFGVKCLSARISELRAMGHDITTRTEDGYSVYSL